LRYPSSHLFLPIGLHSDGVSGLLGKNWVRLAAI
jgi:hypothetical protein